MTLFTHEYSCVMSSNFVELGGGGRNRALFGSFLSSPIQLVATNFGGPASRRFLENGGTIENAQSMADHDSPRTTKLYDRTDDGVTLDEIERIEY
jgi:hypothetical protein